jgi:MFS family permease
MKYKISNRKGASMKQRQFLLFLLASGMLGITQSVDSSVFNNFLSDVYHITVFQRTQLEIPREFPGFAVVFVTGLLFLFGDVRTAAIANLLGAVGIFGVAFLSPGYAPMVLWLLVYSMGQHLFMPMSNSIAMELADEGNMGKMLGQINALNTAVFLVSNLTLALVFRYFKLDYRWAFGISALAFLGAAGLMLSMKPHQGKRTGKRFVFRREYTLYYWLNIVFGARKQIFITFGPWVLIKVFGQGVSTFALLGFIIAGSNIFFKPFVGYLIDKVGEKFVLAGEAALLILVCLGYAFAQPVLVSLGMDGIVLIVICACFVLDQLLAAAGMARATYLRKIALSPEDVSPTLSMGTTLDHIVSMFVPWLAGYVWIAFGYEYVFVGGAGIALINLFLTSRISLNVPRVEKDSLA